MRVAELRFWDSSALVPLLVDEPNSGAVMSLVDQDNEIVAWWGSSVECASAIRRREREGALDARGTEHALALLDQLRDSIFEIQPSRFLRAAAERALAVHPLRAADALQLAAATTWRGQATRADLVCLDERLRDAAAREGFVLVPGR
ncbi:MAG: PIN domain-containing protein [Acidimicrobiia bacterium]|nr:PIN domain-containing protein [Acidimicrobiia bacterium]